MSDGIQRYRALLALGAASAGLIGCKAHASDAAPAASASAAPAAGSASALGAASPAKPWFAGGFAGEYQAKQLPVDVKVGAVREWTTDDGKASSGPGKVSLQIGDDGVVDGSTEGALGPSHLTGKVEEDTLRAQLSPNDETGLRGVLVASRDGDGFKGSIEASTGDSLRVRQATVELKKQTN
jgi:hypothetical protein